MDTENFCAIRDKVSSLRNRLADSPFGKIPESVFYLDEMINCAVSLEDKAALYPLLLSECVRCGNQNLDIYFLRKQIEDLQDDPLPLTSLAIALSYDPMRRDEALALSNEAVALAKRQNRQVKYSLTCQARVALQSGEFSVFNHALRELIMDAPNRREEDHRLEFDFLDYAKSEQIDKALVAQYLTLKNQ